MKAGASGERAPRVLVVGTVLGQPMGGVHRHAKELLPRVGRRLLERGGALAVLAGRDGLEGLDLPPEVVQIASDVPAAPVLARWRAESSAVRAALAAAAEPFELVHSGHLPAPHHLGLPRTHTVHDLRALDPRLTSGPRRWLARRMLSNAVSEARHTFTVSEHVRGQIVAHFGIAADRTSVLHNGADHLEPLPRRNGETPFLLYVGHLERRKNLELLLRALAAHPDLPALWLAGASKAGEDVRLTAVAERLGIADRVRLLGPVSDTRLRELYSTAAGFVLPSLEEGFGIPVAEAQLARVPVAIARAGALGEVAAPGTPSFAAEDPDDCAAALRAALNLDDASIDRAAEHARRFRWDAAADAWFSGWMTSAQR